MGTPDTPVPPEQTLGEQLSARQRMVTMGGLSLALFLVAVYQTIVFTALPRIVAELQGFDLYAWVFTAYMLTSTAFVPIFGKLSDQLGRKWLLVSGLAVFLGASAFCGLAQSMLHLIIFRGVQGLGAGLLLSSAFTIVGDLFPPAERGKWHGLFGAVFGIASVVGPVLGGYLTDQWSWRWVFYINLPLGLGALIVLARSFPAVRPTRAGRPIDFAGAGALLLFVIPLLLAFSWAGTRYAWVSTPILGLLAGSIAALGLFVWIEARVPEPILPLALFRNRVFAISSVALVLSGATLYGSITFVPLFLQGVIGESATQSGALLTPLLVSMVLTSIVSGQVLSRTRRYRYLTALAFLVTAGGMFLLSLMGPDTANTTAIRNMVIVGVGLGTLMPIFTIVVPNALPYHLLGVATAATQFFRNIGGTIGVAIFGSLLASRFDFWLDRRLSPAVENTLPPEIAAALTDPQTLLTPTARIQLESQLAGQPSLQPIWLDLLDTMRASLALTLGEIFRIEFVLALLGCLLILFLPELPLRGAARPRAVEGAQPASATPAGRAVDPRPS